MASIRKRGKTYTITVYMGYDSNGKQLKKTTTFKPPENCSETKARKLAQQFSYVWEHRIRGYTLLNENQTLESLVEWYYECIAPNRLKPWCIKRNREAINNHILPSLGNIRLKNITPLLLEQQFIQLLHGGNKKASVFLKNPERFQNICRRNISQKAGISISTVYAILRGDPVSPSTALAFSNAMQTTPDFLFDSTESSKGLAPASINKLRDNLSAIFHAAVSCGILLKNPCHCMSSLKESFPQRPYLSVEECRELLNLLRTQDDREFELIILTLLCTGMRIGELLALHWRDYDEARSVIYIRHTLARNNGEWFLSEPKTKSSYRRIVLPASLSKQFSIYRARYSIGNPSDDFPIFPNRNGNYLHSSTLNARLKRLIRGTTLPQAIHLHSLRHTHASLLINANIPPNIVADRLGHSSVKTTLDIYSHVYREKEFLTADIINSLLLRDSPQKNLQSVEYSQE